MDSYLGPLFCSTVYLLYSYSFGSWKFRVKMPAGLVSGEAYGLIDG
jgi:hypothetical protein